MIRLNVVFSVRRVSNSKCNVRQKNSFSIIFFSICLINLSAILRVPPEHEVNQILKLLFSLKLVRNFFWTKFEPDCVAKIIYSFWWKKQPKLQVLKILFESVKRHLVGLQQISERQYWISNRFSNWHLLDRHLLACYCYAFVCQVGEALFKLKIF